MPRLSRCNEFRGLARVCEHCVPACLAQIARNFIRSEARRGGVGRGEARRGEARRGVFLLSTTRRGASSREKGRRKERVKKIGWPRRLKASIARLLSSPLLSFPPPREISRISRLYARRWPVSIFYYRAIISIIAGMPRDALRAKT